MRPDERRLRWDEDPLNVYTTRTHLCIVCISDESVALNTALPSDAEVCGQEVHIENDKKGWHCGSSRQRHFIFNPPEISASLQTIRFGCDARCVWDLCEMRGIDDMYDVPHYLFNRKIFSNSFLFTSARHPPSGRWREVHAYTGERGRVLVAR